MTEARKRKRPDRRRDGARIQFSVHTPAGECVVSVPSFYAHTVIPQFPVVDFELLEGGSIEIVPLEAA